MGKATFLSNSALSTARWFTCRLNSWTSVNGFRSFSGTGIGSLHYKVENISHLSVLPKRKILCRRLIPQSSYSMKIGCALNKLILASSSSNLFLSSISLLISSSCLMRLSSSKGSVFVHGLGSGFGGIWQDNMLKWANLCFILSYQSTVLVQNIHTTG